MQLRLVILLSAVSLVTIVGNTALHNLTFIDTAGGASTVRTTLLF
jgi:hypothetical protein